MGIFSRISDIANANILHMLEKAEDPEKMVRLMIQEMEDTLVEVKSSAAKVIAEQRQIEREIDLLNKDEQKWQEKAELAISKERDDLARGALAEKAKRVEKRNELTDQLEHLNQSLKSFRSDINALEEKLLDAKKRRKQLIIRNRTVQSQYNIQKTLQYAKSRGAFEKFERFERDMDRIEGESDSMRMGITKEKSLEEELNELKQQSIIEDELLMLKKKLGKESLASTTDVKEEK